MRCHIIAFFLGFLLDLVLGDPYCLPHPIRLIGRLITGIEKKLHKEKTNKKSNKDNADFWCGIVLVIMVLVSVVTVVLLILCLAYRLNPYMGMAAECIMTYQILAVKCLKVESMKVYKCLQNGNLKQARAAVSMIVGRDTEHLDEEAVTKAAIETVAENTSDGVVAPMLYLAIGGPVFGFLYKAINTMDSMIGYKNDKYMYFGRAAAKLDDFVNYLPSRISAGLMIASAFFAGREFSVRDAWKIYKRDRNKHASPNSGHTEAVCAGALGIKLAGDASYFGKTVKKPYIGDALRNIEYEDIRRANRLMYVTAWLCEVICLSAMWIISC
ncbi:MAG: adenosylcobinamide-phosphate synthase CbiB [Lachnospiraceae bacterium]|nr:adenosylcobinamide-phosphate synthase CbiB [Lachnospiraceae bacterium]